MSVRERNTPKPTSGSDLSHEKNPDFSLTLGHDLLWHIFSINADMDHGSEDNFPALHATRSASQTCSAWRDLIINSPSLWGRVINFDLLRQEDWRKEVLRRTGGSDLSLRGGRIGRGLVGIEDVVISVLAENWSRVRVLNLFFDEDIGEKNFKHGSDFWRLLERPSDVLESFTLSVAFMFQIGELVDNIISPPKFKIFDNHAPSLRKFIAPNLRFNIRAAWISGIRHLALNTPIPVHELLEALTHMPFLETLENHGIHVIVPGHPNRTHHIVLPRLKNITLSIASDMTPYLTFLALIEPIQGRLLSFSSQTYFYSDHNAGARAIASASAILSTYSKHAGLEACNAIDLHILRTSFYFSARLPSGKGFNFFVDHASNPSARTSRSVELWSALGFPKFSQANILRLHLQENIGILPSDLKISMFLASVGNATILETTPETIRFLLRVPEEYCGRAFPMAYRLVISDLMQPREDIESLHAFLSVRAASGNLPYSVFIHAGHIEIDVKPLEKFKGLRVMVDHHGARFKEYVCKGRAPQEDVLYEPMD